ncbi:MAG TPA: hypothetical protein VN231_02365 [Allosphingosinicella sp.]|nr:hypothetical protein [Allosphingosinicella sp.]
MVRLLAAGLVLVGTAAAAQVSLVADRERVLDRPRGPDNDPNRMVCVNELQIGSRLARSRVCRTRAEWAQVREQTRRVIDRVQFNKQTCGNGGAGGCAANPIGKD